MNTKETRKRRRRKSRKKNPAWNTDSSHQKVLETIGLQQCLLWQYKRQLPGKQLYVNDVQYSHYNVKSLSVYNCIGLSTAGLAPELTTATETRLKTAATSKTFRLFDELQSHSRTMQ